MSEQVTFIGQKLNLNEEALKLIIGDGKNASLSVKFKDGDKLYLSSSNGITLETNTKLTIEVGDSFTITPTGEIEGEALKERKSLAQKVSSPTSSGCADRKAIYGNY